MVKKAGFCLVVTLAIVHLDTGSARAGAGRRLVNKVLRKPITMKFSGKTTVNNWNRYGGTTPEQTSDSTRTMTIKPNRGITAKKFVQASNIFNPTSEVRFGDTVTTTLTTTTSSRAPRRALARLRGKPNVTTKQVTFVLERKMWEPASAAKVTSRSEATIGYSFKRGVGITGLSQTTETISYDEQGETNRSIVRHDETLQKSK